MLLDKKKKIKSLPVSRMASLDEAEEEEEPLPEGFSLRAEHPHCLNISKAEGFQTYIRFIVKEFEKIVKAGWPPWGSHSFNFMHFFGKFGKTVCWCPLESWGPLLREILDSPL